MRFALTSNLYKDPAFQTLQRVHDSLVRLGADVMIDARHCQEGLDFPCEMTADFSSADMLISMGGDGTFLNAVHSLRPYDVPLVGINLGSVGFLAQIDLQDLEKSLERLISGDYTIEERMLIDVYAEHADGERFYEASALNEVLLSRGKSQRVVPVRLFLDDTYIELIRCDGILLGTSTGSTGYAMAAGGPIIDPKMHVLEMTPVCPYSMQNRTYVLHPDTRVRLELAPYPKTALLTADGREEIRFLSGDRAYISQAARPIRLVRLQEQNFFQALPDKLRVRSELYQDL